MGNEYKVIANFEGDIGKVFNRCFRSEGFSIILSEGNLLIAKKGDDNNINVEYERIINEQVKEKTNNCKSNDILFLDLTNEYTNIMNTLGNGADLQNIDKTVFDPINDAIDKANHKL